MHVGRIAGANRDLGRPKGWDEATQGLCASLPVRLEVMDDGVTPCWISAWLPTKEEQLAILAGGVVYLRIVGATHPPVFVWAEAPDPEDENPYGGHDGDQS